MDTSTVTVSRRTLEETPERALVFVRAVARSAAIRGRLQSRGYTQAEHQKGWDLIGLVSGVDLKIPALVEDQEVRHALAELNQLDEDTLSLVDVSLKHRYPLQANALLEGLRPSRDEAEAAVVIAELLKRVDRLEQSGDAQDAEAVALLAERGLDAEERARLHVLTELARRSTPVVQQPDPKESAAAEERYVENLKRLRAWYEEWSGVARIVIKRRDYLIQLGLATRRSQENKDAGEVDPAA